MSYVSAAAQLLQGSRQQSAYDTNASIMRGEQNLSIEEGGQQANQVRHNSRDTLGKQIAAFGASGAGYGGSSARALSQSAVNQEMDALNTKYKGVITGYGYGVQAGLDQSAGNQAFGNAALMAGSKLLAANSSSYTLGTAGDLGATG